MSVKKITFMMAAFTTAATILGGCGGNSSIRPFKGIQDSNTEPERSARQSILIKPGQYSVLANARDYTIALNTRVTPGKCTNEFIITDKRDASPIVHLRTDIIGDEFKQQGMWMDGKQISISYNVRTGQITQDGKSKPIAEETDSRIKLMYRIYRSATQECAFVLGGRIPPGEDRALREMIQRLDSLGDPSRKDILKPHERVRGPAFET